MKNDKRNAWILIWWLFRGNRFVFHSTHSVNWVTSIGFHFHRLYDIENRSFYRHWNLKQKSCSSHRMFEYLHFNWSHYLVCMLVVQNHLSNESKFEVGDSYHHSDYIGTRCEIPMKYSKWRTNDEAKSLNESPTTSRKYGFICVSLKISSMLQQIHSILRYLFSGIRLDKYCNVQRARVWNITVYKITLLYLFGKRNWIITYKNIFFLSFYGRRHYFCVFSVMKCV